MVEVRVISRSIVPAANHRETRRIELSPWDLLLLPFPHIQKGLLFLKPKPNMQAKETENTLIHHLKASVSQTLDYFPPLAGRLATTDHHEDNTVSFFLDCNNAGALFIHAEAHGVTTSDITQSIFVPQIVHSFFPLNGLKNYEGVANPLLGIQVTDLADGIFIGCSINHCVADGTSFWHFFNSWSEISRGSISISKPPIFQRWSPNGNPIRIPISHLEQVYTNNKLSSPPDQIQVRIFHFKRQNIAKLKAKANSEVGTNNSISSLQALLSHIWRSVIRNKDLDANEVTTYNISIGTRQRFGELTENYFGNAMMGGLVAMKVKELLNEASGKVALQMNRVIAAVTEESIKKFLVSWSTSPKLVTMDYSKKNKGLVTNSSPRFNMYGNDFGWGKPIAVRSGLENKSDGKITLFCGAEEGSIDVEACLVRETLEAMASDEEFMDTVTI